MRLNRTILFLIFFTNCQALFSQQSRSFIEKGNEFYLKGKYQEAQKEFTKVGRKDSLNEIAQYNLGNTLFRLGKYDDAANVFDQLSEKSNDSNFLARLAYNEGVAYSNSKELEESIAAYKKSLMFYPGDVQARENLQKALLELKKKNTPPEKKQSKPPPKINPKDAARKLKNLEQKEKQTQQKVQNEKSVNTGVKSKDW